MFEVQFLQICIYHDVNVRKMGICLVTYVLGPGTFVYLSDYTEDYVRLAKIKGTLLEVDRLFYFIWKKTN